MKIKKVFALASIASLAILMSACGNKKKNATIFDADFFDLLDQDITDYKKENEAKKKVVKVFENEKVYDHSGAIYITEDSSNYYVYNLELEEKKIITLEKSGIDNIEINSQRYTIIVRYEKNANNNYAYEAYLLDGTKLFDKVYCAYNLAYSSGEGGTIHISEFEKIKPTQLTVTYTDEDYKSTTIYFYVVEHTTTDSGISLKEKTVKEYYIEKDYNEKYGSAESYEVDGKMYGLDGYTIRTSNNTYFLFKKGKFVNKIEFCEGAYYIVSNGYALVQTTKKVSSSEDYDIDLFGEFYQLSTYKICLKNSKVTELKNFHYFFMPLIPVYKDGVIENYICQAFDIKANKQATGNNYKVALINGKGKVEINEAVTYSGSLLLNDNDTYYGYRLSSAHQAVEEKTTVYNKKGDITAAYDGIYYDGITVNVNGDSATFIGKDGKLKAILSNFTRLSLGLYKGTDIFGNNVFVEIKDGDVIIADLGGYYSGFGEFLTKASGTTVEFYTYDATLTKLEFTLTTDDEMEYVAAYDGVSYYTCTNTSNEVTLVYFE